MIRTLAVVLVFAMSLPCPAAADSVEDLAWMAGDWRSEGGLDLAQEVWTRPAAGSMTGMFRLINGGRVTVFEYIVIADEADGVYYQFKHFRPDYSTWEGSDPPLRFELVDMAPGRAVFRNTRQVEGQPSYISYLLGADGRLTIMVGDAPDADDEYRGFRFVLTNMAAGGRRDTTPQR